MTLVIILVVLLAVFYWIVKRPVGRARRVPRRGEVDDETLTAAEDEVRDVDPFASPDEAEEELRDWGPGAPK